MTVIKRVLLLLICLALLTGCNQPTGYELFSQQKGVDHYSFEYPANYDLKMNRAYDDPRAPNGVALIGSLSDGSEIVILLEIAPYTFFANVQAAAEGYPLVKGRQLLQHSEGIISGVPCEIITLLTETNPVTGLTSKYTWMSFFDHGSRLWTLSVYSELNKTEEVQTEFDHLVSSFKIMP